MSEPAPTRFRVRVLGPFEVWCDDRSLGAASWQRSVQTLLKLLATSPERRRLRDEVVDTLWPDATPEAGANNVRYVLSVLRRNLGGGMASPILVDRIWISLNPAHSWDIDLVRFEQLAARADRDTASMEEFAAAYHAEPLIEDRYEDWAAPLRAHIERTWLETCRRCAGSLRTRQELEPALVWLERALQVDPLDEDSFQQVLRLLMQLGRRSEAARRFHQFEAQLRSELDLDPSPETRALLSQARDLGQPAALPSATPPSYRDGDADGVGSGQSPPSGAYLGALAVMPLVARREELSRIIAGIDAAAEGQGKLLLLAGEPGVGKTRLAQEVTVALHGREFLVATGRCYELEQVVPYYPFLDVLAEITRLVPRGLRDAIPQRWPYLVRLLPELQSVGMALPSASIERARTSGPPPGILPGSGQDETLLIRAVAGFVSAATADRPLAILLDDLHWSDSASMKLLLHLARHTSGQRVFLLGTYRDLDLTTDHPLHGALIDLTRERLIEKIALGRLDAEGTKALIAESLDGAALPPGLVEIVHGPANGNPFFVGEIVRSMVEEGDLFRKNGIWDRRQRVEIRVPESVRAVLGQRLSRLAEHTQGVLGAASVLGQTFRFDEVECVSGLTEAEVEGALDEAARAGLVRESRPDTYAFSHALAQAAVYAEMSGRRQRRLHLAAAETIEAGPERERRAAEIASHFLLALDQERAIPYSLLAGDAARDVFAYAEAERHYRLAEEASREIGNTAQGSAALERLAASLQRQARYSDAEDCARQAVREFQRLADHEGELQAACRLSEILEAQGNEQDAFAMLETLGDSMDVTFSSPGMARLYLRLADLALDLGDHQQQETMAVKAVAIAQALGDRRLSSRAELAKQAALLLMGRPNEGYRVAQDHVRLLEEVGDLLELVQMTTALTHLAFLRGNLHAGREYGEQALDFALRIGDPVLIANALHGLGSSLFMLGDWQGARAHLERAFEMARPLDASADLPSILCDLGHLTVCEGDWDAGEALLQEALKRLEATDTRALDYLPHLRLAHLELLRGHPQKALERLTPLVDRYGNEAFRATPLLPPLATAYLDLGDTDRAEALTRDVLRRTESPDNRLDLVAALLVRARVLERHGRKDEAREMLQDVLRHSREMSFPAPEAEALFKLGALETASGEMEAARSAIIQAREIWRRLGARKEVERADEALAHFPPTATSASD